MINNKIYKQIEISSPVEKIWKALTDPKKIKVYLFGTNTTCDWKKGSEILFHGKHEGTTYLDKGIITEIEKNKTLSYTYLSSFSNLEDIPENYSWISFSVTRNKNKSILSMEMDNFQSEENRKHASSSWDQVLGMLKNLVEKEYLQLQS